jgi:pimeloyl-ACP methyl ester carboxylesterase/sugar lactone lactonase YvrE
MLLLLAATFVPTGTARADFKPTFESVACPGAVVTDDGSDLSCGYLTVLENRADPGGGTIRLFVAIADPGSGSVPADPVYVPGDNLAWSWPVERLGTRADRRTIWVDQRGTGLSEPNLACPEVRRLTDPSFGVTLGTPEMRADLLAAVEACHDRLTSRGIELDAYNLEEMASDAEDLRVALGIDEWNLLSYGSASAIEFEIMRRYPEHVRAAAFDSPLPLGLDRFTAVIKGTRWAFDEIVAACSVQPSCDDAYPHLHRAWRSALRRLDEHPSHFSDEDLDVLVDDATAVRYLANNMAQSFEQTRDIPEFPLAVYQLRKDGWKNSDRAGNEVGWAAAPPLQVGYDLEWGDLSTLHFNPRPLSHGTFYSVICHDEMPFVDEVKLERAAGGRSWYVDAYVHNPYAEICERWNVEAAEEDPRARFASDVPVLLMTGRFNPYSPLPLARRTARGFSHGSVIGVPTRSNFVLGTDCAVGIRNAFMEHPRAPLDTSCIAELQDAAPVRFLSPPTPTREPGPGEAEITTVVGDGAFGSSGDGNLATQAQLALQNEVVVDDQGNVYVSDPGRIRKLDPTGRISTVVGPPTGVAAPPPGEAANVDLTNAGGLGIDDEGHLYIGGGDGTHRIIIRVDPRTGEVTRIAGTGEKGDSGDGGPATEATMTHVHDIAVDSEGNVYLADFAKNRIRVIDPLGTIHTFAGTGEAGFSGDGGPATEATLHHPSGIALDDDGNLYIADRRNHRVRRVNRHGIITTIAGNGKDGYSGDGGPATSARLHPGKVVVDSRGKIYIRGALENQPCGCVRMVDRKGIITTVIGRRTPGFSGDGGPAKLAQLSCCGAMAFGPDGALYVADEENWRIRKVVFG